MKYILCLLPLAATAFAGSSGAVEAQAEDPVLGTETVHGCYSSLGGLTLNGTDQFNTKGFCSSSCRGAGFAVAASQSADCYCGDEYPADSAQVDDAECSEPCPGYPVDSCGGPDAYTVYNTGLELHVASSDDSSSSSSASANATANIGASTAATAIATASGTASNSTVSATGTSATTSSTAVVDTSGASAQLPVVGLNMAVLGLGAALLM